MECLLVTVHAPVAFHSCGGWGAWHKTIQSRKWKCEALDKVS